jgi:transcriptional regulator with XRE-family HTH domain
MRWVIRTADDLADAIRELRRQRGVTQEEVAEWIGAHRNYVGQLERGDVSTQLTRLLDALSYLGVDMELASRGRR